MPTNTREIVCCALDALLSGGVAVYILHFATEPSRLMVGLGWVALFFTVCHIVRLHGLLCDDTGEDMA